MSALSGLHKWVEQCLARRTWDVRETFRSPFLWSKGVSQQCDFRGDETYWLQPTESCQPASFFRQHYTGASGLVWVRLSTLSRNPSTCDLDHFVEAALPTIQKPFSLITTDGDAAVPS